MDGWRVFRLPKAGFVFVVLAFVGATCLKIGYLAAQEQESSGSSAKKVKVQVAAQRPDAAGNQAVTFNLTIDRGWHIFANSPENDRHSRQRTVRRV